MITHVPVISAHAHGLEEAQSGGACGKGGNGSPSLVIIEFLEAV